MCGCLDGVCLGVGLLEWMGGNADMCCVARRSGIESFSGGGGLCLCVLLLDLPACFGGRGAR